MASTPSGMTHAIASAFAASKIIEAISNATEAVITSTAHGFANGDILEITSGWTKANLVIARVKSTAANTFVAEGLDTSDTTLFPAGSGIGSVRKVSGWTQIAQIHSPQITGGEPKEVNYKYLEDDQERIVYDGFSALKESFEVDADSAGTPGWIAMLAATRAGSNTVIRKILRSGAVIYESCKVALNPNPRISEGNTMRCAVGVAVNSNATRYAS